MEAMVRVEFKRQSSPHNVGETAAFPPEMAEKLRLKNAVVFIDADGKQIRGTAEAEAHERKHTLRKVQAEKGLGSNDVFTIVETGLKEGDRVVLNPLAFAQEQTTPATTLETETP